MSKYVVGGLLLGVAIVSLPFLASAQSPATTSELQNKISLIKAQIAELTSRIQAISKVQPSVVSPTSGQVELPVVNLKPGDQGVEVKKLQSFLKEQGYFPVEVPATGYYGEKTAEAVKKLQYELKILPEFKSPGVTEKADYLKKLEEQKPTEGRLGRLTVISSGQFDPCFEGTEGTLDKDGIDICVKDKLGYGTFGSKTREAMDKKVEALRLVKITASTPTAPTVPARGRGCKGDMNNDGWVNNSDLRPFISLWGVTVQNKWQARADFNDSGVIDHSDLGAFLSLIGGEGTPCP